MAIGIALGFSGGVDSTLAAVNLAQAGYQVHAVHLNFWKWQTENEPHVDIKLRSVELQQVSDVTLASIDASDSMRKLIINDFQNQLAIGNTPSPCIRCNPLVKFRLLLKYADEHHLDMIATGHYARIERSPGGLFSLHRALDLSKDQAYMLCYLNQEILSRTVFPLGNTHKSENKKIARQLGLSIADQPESQDLCFLNQHSYQDFVKHFSPEILVPGDIVNQQGEILGRHEGLALYTIGQRKGIKIASQEAYYVVEKDMSHNRLVVGYLNELGKKEMIVEQVNWISGHPCESCECDVKIRYQAKLVPASLRRIADSNNYKVQFQKEMRDITPGQYAVFYQRDEVLGGGMISRITGQNV